MKIRDSGMPEESYWESLFDIEATLVRLGINQSLHDVVELGCGYGTFTIPVAEAISGTLYSFDIDPAMVERTCARAGQRSLVCQVRDVVKDGFGIENVDAALLFNILHTEAPQELLRHAAAAVRPGGLVLVTHWRVGETPRGPSLDIRPCPEQIIAWAEATGRLRLEGEVIDLPPWHYGLRLRQTLVGSESPRRQ